MNRITFFSFTFFLLFAEMIHAEAPNLANNWREINLNMEECLVTSEKLMEAAGFTLNKNNKHYKRIRKDGVILGKRSKDGIDYKGAVRCVPEMNIIFFAVAGEREVLSQLELIYSTKFCDLEWGVEKNFCD